MLIRSAGRGHQRAAEREREGRGLAHIDGDQLRGDGIDRHRPDGGAGPGAGHGEVEGERQRKPIAKARMRLADSVAPSTGTGIDRKV